MLALAIKSITHKDGWADGLGISLAGLCFVHCVVTSVLLAFFAAAGGLFFAPIIHEVGLVLAIGLGILGLGQGLRRHGLVMPAAIGTLGIAIMVLALSLPHGGIEILLTMVGAIVLALAHILNYRATH